MAEILGGVGAGVALCVTLTDIALKVRKATKRIKNSRRDIAELSDETVIFAGLCEGFLRDCADDQEARSYATSSILPLYTWIQRTTTGLSELLRKVEAIGPAPKHRYSIQERLIAFLEWFFSKDIVKRLRNSLTVARESINGFSNLTRIRKLNEELDMLKRALSNQASRKQVELSLGMSVEKKIRIVQQAIEIRSSVHHTNKRILKAVKQEVVLKEQGTHTPDLDDTLVDLFDFTESFTLYSREVMPSVKSGRHRSSRYAPSSSSGSSLAQAPRKSWHSGDVGSTTTPIQPKNMRNSTPAPSHPSTSDLSTGSHSSNSLYIHSETLSPPTSVTSSSSTDKSRESNLRSAKPNSTFTEPQDFRRREYINPTNRDILGRPEIKSQTGAIPVTRTHRIGHHEIVLDAKYVQVDKKRLRLDTYEIGHRFFETMLENEDKIEELIQALAMEGEEETWDGLLGWRVDTHGVHYVGVGDEG